MGNSITPEIVIPNTALTNYKYNFLDDRIIYIDEMKGQSLYTRKVTNEDELLLSNSHVSRFTPASTPSGRKLVYFMNGSDYNYIYVTPVDKYDPKLYVQQRCTRLTYLDGNLFALEYAGYVIAQHPNVGGSFQLATQVGSQIDFEFVHDNYLYYSSQGYLKRVELYRNTPPKQGIETGGYSHTYRKEGDKVYYFCNNSINVLDLKTLEYKKITPDDLYVSSFDYEDGIFLVEIGQYQTDKKSFIMDEKFASKVEIPDLKDTYHNTIHNGYVYYYKYPMTYRFKIPSFGLQASVKYNGKSVSVEKIYSRINGVGRNVIAGWTKKNGVLVKI
ncbi:MAG: hypothetical protein E6Y49_09780 [Clostridium sporogenes]|nr:hypothetical protein [Clostridium sporogenes]